MIANIPLPARDGPFEEGFWSALDAGGLAHQRCHDCRRWHFPPRYRCSDCGGGLVYEPVSGLGTLWSFTLVHAPVLPAFAPFAPFVAAVVELDEQPGLRMAGNLIHRAGDPINAVAPQSLTIGMPLRAVILPLSEDVRWPQWVLISKDSAS